MAAITIIQHPSPPSSPRRHPHPQVYIHLAERMEEAGRARGSHDYLGREFTLGGFYRVTMFGPGMGESRVGAWVVVGCG
jgi:hypothetical protein